MRARWSMALGVLLMTSTPRLALAFECKVSEAYAYVSLRWADRLIPYGIRAPGSSELSAETTIRAIDGAFREWEKEGCTDIRFVSSGVVSESSKGVNQIVFVPQGWSHPREAVALTRTTYGTQDGLIRGATIEVNEELFVFRDVASGCPPAPPTYDINAVLTHEVGHLIGLDHTRNFSRDASRDPTMAPEVGTCEMDKRSIEADDIEGLCLLYPRDAPSGQCEELPEQPEPYVSNTPFGCTAAASRRPDGPVELREGALFAALVLLLLVSRTMHLAGRWRTCPLARSG